MKSEKDKSIELANQIQAREFLERKGYAKVPCICCNGTGEALGHYCVPCNGTGYKWKAPITK